MKTRILIVTACLALAGCSEDLGPITKLWAETQNAFNGDLASWGKLLAGLKEKAASFGMIDAADSAGTELKGKLDGAIASFQTGITNSDTILKTGGAAVADALKAGKIMGVQTAIEKVKSDWSAAAAKVTAEPKNIEALIGQLTTHVADMKAKAEASAKAPVGNAGGDANAVPKFEIKDNAEADFSGVEFDNNTDKLALGKANTKVNLEALISLMNSCNEMVVEVEGHTSKVGDAKKNKELSAKRAQAVTRHLINVGKVSPSKIKKTYGYGSEKPAMTEPEPGSAEEKSMDPAALAAVRDRNDRIHLRILKSCPAK
jgi:outer membrane protein OmpA-like peptidoglycan-associated protein